MQNYTIEIVQECNPEIEGFERAVDIVYTGLTLSGAMLKLEQAIKETGNLTEIKIRMFRGNNLKQTLTYPAVVVKQLKYSSNILDDAIRSFMLFEMSGQGGV